MSGLSARDASAQLGVSARRVGQMIASGQLDAGRVGTQWVIDPASLPARPLRRGRPLAARAAWALLLHPDPGAAPWLRADEAYRLRTKVRELLDDPDALVRVRSWLSARSHVERMSSPDPGALLADPRVVPGGVSDPRAGMSAASEAEAYIAVNDHAAVVADQLLVPERHNRSNVVLHVSPLPMPRPAPLLAIAVDLADRGGPREYLRAQELLNQWSEQARGARLIGERRH